MVIGIIGTGLSGTLTAIHLLRSADSPIHIVLFEKDAKRFARGVAYSNDFTYQPLNVSAEGMSLFRNEPLHFYNWVLERKNDYALPENFSPDSFISRKIFGDYLTYTLEQTIQNYSRHSVTLVYDEVSNIAERNNQYILTTAHAKEYRCGKVVLATGNFPPAHLSATNQKLRGHEKYEANPWREGLIDSIGEKEDILFVGAGLTMVDLLINLKEKGHEGNVFILSRSGLLPKLHQANNPASIEWADEELYSGIRNLFTALRGKTREAKSSGTDWRNVIDSLRPYVPSIWKSFNAKEKKLFFSRLRTYWEIHRHRIPPLSMKLIENYIDNGGVKMFAGKLKEIFVEEEGFSVTFTAKKTGINNLITTGRIINCTGPESNYKNLDDTFTYQLLIKGYATQDETQFGLNTSQSGALIDHSGNISQHLFTLGPTRKGTEWESTALREIRLQAEILAKEIIRIGTKKLSESADS